MWGTLECQALGRPSWDFAAHDFPLVGKWGRTDRILPSSDPSFPLFPGLGGWVLGIGRMQVGSGCYGLSLDLSLSVSLSLCRSLSLSLSLSLSFSL